MSLIHFFGDGFIWGGRRQSWNFLQINNLQILENVEKSRIFQCSEQDISATRKDFSKIPKDSERSWSETSISGTFSARNNPCTFSPRFQITVIRFVSQKTPIFCLLFWKLEVLFFWHWKHHFWTFQELSFSEHQKLSSNSKNSRRYNTLCRAHNLWVYIIAGSLAEEMWPAKIVYVSHSKGPNFLQNDAIHFFFFF